MPAVRPATFDTLNVQLDFSATVMIGDPYVNLIRLGSAINIGLLVFRRPTVDHYFMGAERKAGLDGRAVRAQRTRTAVATALLDLLEEGIIEPTAGQIARRAKVSERLVFHHFADLETLHATAAELQMARVLPLIKPVDPTLPFEERLAECAAARARLFERVSPVVRAALRREPFSREIAKRLRADHELSRNLALAAFSRELVGLAPEESAEISPALSWAASWESWEYLRRREGLSVRRASKVMERMIGALLRKGGSSA
jgi:TetR/AcrR family transcriptional regulator, regulator of autoinduction and epiphytic fitness